MNDFTKEELEEIIQFMYEVEAEHNAHPEKILMSHPLYLKVQSMLENYCEHERIVSNYDPQDQCRNCGKIV